jgi:exportin-2 (importin alpha re-exporter)
MQQFSQGVFTLLLTRLQTKPSTQFTQGFVYFALFLCAIESVGPEYLISSVDALQPG